MSRNTEATDDVKTWTGGPLNYKEGFFTQLATDELAKGINEEVVRAISAKRNEPEWMLEFRLNAYHAWLEMEEPHWLKAHYDKLNYQDYSYYSAPSCGNCDDNCASEPGAVQQTGANAFLSKEVEAAFEQLGVPVREGKEVAVDDGILGGLKDILFGTTGPRGGKKDGVVQTMAKSAARQVTNQIVRGMLGSLLGGRRR